jgi:dihydrofolate reductase
MPGRLVYSMSTSLDGFAAREDGSIDWVTVDEELHRAFNEEARDAPVFLHGRRMHELMEAYWPTADQNPDAGPVELEFAGIYRAAEKVVFSRTLAGVGPQHTLVTGDATGYVFARKAQGASMGVGGPTLAGTLLEAGLVDEVRAYVNPVVLGSGLRFLPALDGIASLHLVDVRRFDAGVVLLRYEVVATAP